MLSVFESFVKFWQIQSNFLATWFLYWIISNYIHLFHDLFEILVKTKDIGFHWVIMIWC